MTTVAVVIPTYNSARTLAACLDSLAAQTVPPAEVIVVDDVRSTDRTREIADRVGVTTLVDPAGMAGSRNVGVASATSTVVLMVDSDMVLMPGVVAAVAHVFDAGAVAAAIPEVAFGVGYWARARALDKAGVEASGIGVSLRAVRRDLFVELGGYNEELEAGEDADFHARVCTRGMAVVAVSAPDAKIEHDEGHLTLWSNAKKKFRYGRSYRAFVATTGLSLSSGALYRVRAGVRAARHDPWALPGFVLLKVVDVVAGCTGMLVARCTSRT